ncbi:carbohydrate esterase family 5 protein [Aplosporella prunicola CBS 121167]|uniref:cutinase n=1 Tax=Aplosporella prunicola CBS 121167 TaxID=1176127 RepID=A0A6A6BQB7_9PEZI|nr:carbohydrate esterase family 5 protein [Aplosporella prunicola CBS 121167]KAF2146200.1 carbohydrate esterase family 5 protein [Aplosporella prunicola CBS 121167]
MGSTVGPALSTQLSTALSSDLATQGVTYAADVNGAIQGSISPKTAQGATTMASLTKDVVARCPDTKVVLAGYSQGAQQVHGALMNLDGAALKAVAAVVTFGDPLSKTAFQGVDAAKTKVYCATGDQVCDGMFVITAAHLSYATASVPGAVDFVKGLVA